jgi:hypothetical protein
VTGKIPARGAVWISFRGVPPSRTRGTPDPHTLRVQQLFVRHQGQLWAFVFAVWPDFGRADDVLQECHVLCTACRRALRASYAHDRAGLEAMIRSYATITAAKKKPLLVNASGEPAEASPVLPADAITAAYPGVLVWADRVGMLRTSRTTRRGQARQHH